ncbi:acyltransferase [Caballeronia sp. SBC2]|uniref:acyltransferase family protein n=1 Tax=Caballeronia sp. SBC2 TaxID=2705547 RepID=UPI0013E1F4D4|nr:acyltransferase [Caballeronia sp. SBC2]QIE24837.1 Acyltransferase family protein [Caballeronia sp. SBC2]
MSIEQQAAYTASGGKHNASIDGLRGLAAFTVVFYHSFLHFDPGSLTRVVFAPIADVHGWHDLILKFLLSIFNGESAVLIFFILSGLVLARSLNRMNDVPIVSVGKDFILKRLLRIYPAIIVCMVFIFIASIICRELRLPIYPGNLRFETIFRAAALIDVSALGPAWTLQVELCAIPFFLGVYVVTRLIGAYANYLFLFLSLFALQFPILALNYSLLAASMFPLMIGMLLGSDGMRNLFSNLGKGAWVAILLFFVFSRQVVGHEMYTGVLSYTLAGGLLVAVIFYGDNALSRFLCTPIPSFLGRLSYSFYLYNVPISGAIWDLITNAFPAQSTHSILFGALSAIFSTCIAIPLSILSERYVERPGIRLGRWLTRPSMPLADRKARAELLNH